MVNLEYLSSSVSGLMEILVCVKTKMGFPLVDLQKVASRTSFSPWQNKPDRCFTSKICVTQDG